jgi:unsaturated chondroitin disaccharide hydrolase
MKILQTILSILALSLSGGAWAGPIPEAQESAVGFRSFDLPAEQTGTFEVSFDATPLADKIDAFTGIAAMTPREAGDVAAIVRFNDQGTIDVRNGGSFRADQNLPYSANQSYRVRMVIDVKTRTYSVFVTPPGQPEIPLARTYAFRSQQAAVRTLGTIVLAGYAGRDGSFKGPHRVTGVSLKAVPAQ